MIKNYPADKGPADKGGILLIWSLQTVGEHY